MDDELTTLIGLARQLRLSRTWLKGEADAERIPYLKAGAKRLFNVEAVRVVLAERAASGPNATHAALSGKGGTP